jgi:hypothetical protein
MTDSDSICGPLLAIDIGKVSTRAFLFDVVNEGYRFLGAGKAATTLGVYGWDIRHGVSMAIEEIQAITGRILLNAQKDLIRPVSRAGSGVQDYLVTVSAGPPLKIFLAGNVKDAALSSAGRLAKTTCSSQVISVCINEGRKTELIIDDILQYRPDIIIIAGGTNGDGSRSALQLLEPIRLAFLQLPEEYRPEILFIGDKSLRPLVQAAFNASPRLHLGLSTQLDLEHESFKAMLQLMAKITIKIRARQLPGLSDLLTRSSGTGLPSAVGLSRMVHFLGQARDPKKGVLGVDLASSSTTMAAAIGDWTPVGVYPEFGSNGTELDPPVLHLIHEWLFTPHISDDMLSEYFLNKSIYPASLPATGEDLDLGYAIARLDLNGALKQLATDFPAVISISDVGLSPSVEPILATGRVLANAASPGHACLVLLDGLQPIGVRTFVMDTHQMAGSLGAIAEINPVAAAQIVDSGVFMHLATVISPLGHAAPGTPILRIKMTHENGFETTMDVKEGDLEVFPLLPGKSVRLKLQPFHRYDVGMGGAGRGGSVKVMGSVLGVVIDARGRPLKAPENLDRKKELYRKWLWMLGG